MKKQPNSVNKHKLDGAIRNANSAHCNSRSLHAMLRALDFFSYAEESAEKCIAEAKDNLTNRKYKHINSTIPEFDINNIRYGLVSCLSRHVVVLEYLCTREGTTQVFDCFPLQEDDFPGSSVCLDYDALQFVEIRISGVKYNLKVLTHYDFPAGSRSPLQNCFESRAMAVWRNHQLGLTAHDYLIYSVPEELGRNNSLK